MPKTYKFSPNPNIYALRREEVTDDQVRWDEDTIKWGPDDALPLRIMDAVNRSPTATACLDVWAAFINGDGFTDPELEKMVVDSDGTTLIEFHRQLVEYIKLLDSFAVNFKLDQKGRITNSYCIGPDTCRFVKYKGTKVTHIKRNPYFGTSQFTPDLTDIFPVYDPATAKELIQSVEDPGKFMGVMHFWGSLRAPYKFYPVPKYWSGEKWIYVDGEIQQFHKSNLQNGFFQSALINMIGNPNKPSSNPKYQKTETITDGTKRKQSTKTVGEEFNDQMNTIFSGSRKAGTAMVIWSENSDESVKVSSFPVNSQFDVLAGTYNDAIKGICIATGIDPILLTIQGNSLVNSGDSIRAVIDYTESKAKRMKQILENFYNNTMLPNLQSKTSAKVEIKPYVPVSTQVLIDQKFWDVLSDQEKKGFVRRNIPGISNLPFVEEKKSEISPETLQAQAALRGSVGGVQGVLQIQESVGAKTTSIQSALSILTIIYGFSNIDALRLLGQPVDENTGQPIQPTAPPTAPTENKEPEIQINDNLKNMTGRQQQQFLRIVKQFGQGKLTEDQAKVMLRSGFGLTEEEITSILTLE